MAATIDDSQLLADYVRTRSTDALGQLIERHIDFVHAAALRQVHDDALAEDVTQAVFIILTRKAASIRPQSLIGWLFNTTRYCAANARNSELRRRRHERQAAKPEVQMQSDHSVAVPLDNALAALRSSDRQVVLLRFMEQRDFADVATVLGISEQTARRLSRAVERLRHLLSTAGSLLPSATVLETLTTATPKAPVHLLAKTIATATAGAATTGAAGSLAAQTIHMMTWLKLKIAAAILLAAAVAGAGSVAVVKTIGPQAETPVSTAAAPASPAATPAATPGAIATFPDGLRVELIGVTLAPTNGKNWWKPDGSPLPKAPYNHSSGSVSGGPGLKSYEFAVRITGGQPGWSTDVSIPASMGTASGSQRGITDVSVLLPPSPSTTVDFTCATGPWQTRAVIPADAVFSTGYMLNNTISFTRGKDSRNTSITVTADHASMNSVSSGQREFLAIGFDGKPTSPNSWSSNGGLLTETIDLSFPKIRPDQVKEFQIRTRSFNRSAKFENISLIPGQLTTPTVEQHDSGKFVASFRAGGSLEVLGISDLSSPHKWWNADGSASDEIPLAEAGLGAFGGRPGDKTYAIAVKWNHQGDNPVVSFSFSNSRSIGIMNGAAQKSPASPDIYLLTCPAGVTSTNFRVGMTGGAWQIGPTVISDGRAASVTVDKDKFDFSAPADQNGEATITVTDTLSDVQRQLVVTDKSGAIHIARLIRSAQATIHQKSYRIPQISAAQIKSYQLQTRGFEYINFNNITLKPDQHTEITIEPDSPPTPTVAPKPPGEEGL